MTVRRSKIRARRIATKVQDSAHRCDGDISESGALAFPIVNSARLTPGDAVAAETHLNAALRALQSQDKGALDRAIASLAKLGVQLNRVAKATAAWVKEHPWLTAAIVISTILFACTPAIIGAAGFGAGGIAAGIMLVDNLRKSLADENIGSMAAGIQAGIGNVAAGSAFAVLTSAGMGGAGLAIVMGASACVPVVVAGGAAIWTKWLGKKDDDEDKTD
jgi:hypothetical protein